MKKLLWINIFLLLFYCGCRGKRSLDIYYREPPATKLTIKPIIVRTNNNNTSHAKSILLKELQRSGYEIIQDTESTQKLLHPFGVSQVVPTEDFTEILVSIDLDDYTEHSKMQTTKVRLASCNHLMEKDPCTYRDGTIRQINTIVNRNGKIHFTINNAAENPITIEKNLTTRSLGIIPVYTNDSLSQTIRDAISSEFSQYFIRTESVTTPFEIDSMTADFIESGIYDIASKRVKRLESGYKYYFTMGLIEETQKNYSGAKMYYSEGELNTERKELFSNAIKRVDYFLRKK